MTADREELLARHLRRDAEALEPLVVDDEVEHGHLGQVALHVGLHVHGAQLGRGREALDLVRVGVGFGVWVWVGVGVRAGASPAGWRWRA